MRQLYKKKYNVGDIVYWNDSDRYRWQRCLTPGYYKVIEVVDRDTVVLDTDPTEGRIFPGTEVFIWELSE